MKLGISGAVEVGDTGRAAEEGKHCDTIHWDVEAVGAVDVDNKHLRELIAI